MMKSLLIMALLMLPGPVLAELREEHGWGVMRCNEWLVRRRQQQMDGAVAWFEGYFTAYNHFAPDDLTQFLYSGGTGRIISMVDTYCQEKWSHSVAMATRHAMSNRGIYQIQPERYRYLLDQQKQN